MKRWKVITSFPCLATCMLTLACRPLADSENHVEPQAILVGPDLTIGVIEGDSAYQFGDIVSVASDPAGHIYVGDRIGAIVRAYDGSGRYLKRIAREGQGPGEIYGWPADIAVGNNGMIYVRDGSRITIFVPTETAGVADSLAAVWPGYGNLTSSRGRVGDSGIYYFPAGLYLPGQLPRFFYLPVHEGTLTGDTLEVPPYPGLTGRRPAMFRLGADGLPLQGLSHVPFAPLPAWDVTQVGTILSSDGSRDQLIETSLAGDTLRVLSGPTGNPIEVPPAERADSARALGARLDTLPVPIDGVLGLGEGVRERRLPRSLPAVVGISVAADGAIWVERWPGEGQHQSRVYDILDDEGRFQQRVILQAPLMRDPPPFFGAHQVVGVVRDDETGVERVVRFTIAGRPDGPVAK